MSSKSAALPSFYKNKRVLVTGGLGFLGSNLAHALAALGAQVTILDCLLPKHGGNVFNIDSIRSSVKLVEGDLRDQKLLTQILPGTEIIFNIAAQTSHTDSLVHPDLDVDINISGQIHFLQRVAESAPCAKIIYCSSRAVYGAGAGARGETTEEALPRPLDIYAVNKLAGEFYHQIFARTAGLDVRIARLSNVFGPRAQMAAPHFGILNWFIRLAIDNQPIRVFGDGKQVRDYIYVDDASDAFLRLAMEPKLSGQVVNVGSGKGVALIRLIEKIVAIAASGKIEFVPWPEANKAIDVGDFICNAAKIKKLSGWKPQVSFEEGLRQTIAFYRAHRAHYW